MVEDDSLPTLSAEAVLTIRAEYGARADQVLHALDNARLIVQRGSFLPLQRESFAHSVRLAIDGLLDQPGFALDTATNKAIEDLGTARVLYLEQGALGVGHVDAFSPLDARIRAVIGSLERGPQAKQRAAYVFARRVGGLAPQLRAHLDALLALRRRASGAVHGSGSDAQPGDIWSELVVLLDVLYRAPSSRAAELERLAAIQEPDERDFVALEAALLSRADLRNFLRRLKSPLWLELFIQHRWATRELVCDWFLVSDIGEALGQTEEFARFLHELLDQLGTDDEAIAMAIAIPLARLPESVAGPMLRIVKAHPVATAQVAVHWAAELSAESPAVHEVFDLVISVNVKRRSLDVAALFDAMARGITPESFKIRLSLACFKLNRRIAGEDWNLRALATGVSIGEASRLTGRSEGLGLVGMLADSALRALELADPGAVYAVLAQLSGELGARVRTWFATQATSMPLDLRLDCLARAVLESRPNVDAFELFDQLESEMGTRALASAIANRIVPDSAPTADNQERAWTVSRWCDVLPADALSGWGDLIADEQSTPGTLERSYWASRILGDSILQSALSPLSPAEINTGDVVERAREIAAWRPNNDAWNVTARELARALTTAIIAEPARWITGSVDVLDVLEHPTYVGAFAESLASEAFPEPLSPSFVVALCRFVRQRLDAQVTKLGENTPFDYVESWREVRVDCIRAIERLANSLDLRAGPDREALWDFVREMAGEWHQESRSESALEVGVEDLDSFHRAINRPSTRAFGAGLALMGSEFRADQEVGSKSLDFLDDALEVPGIDGTEFRAMIVAHAAFVRSVAGEWWVANLDRLFGGQHDAFGQDASDVLIKWSIVPDEFFEHYRHRLVDAVSRDVDRAAQHVLIAMLRGVDGYSHTSVLDILQDSLRGGEIGQDLAWVLPEEGVIEPDVIARIDEFWRSVLATKSVASARSFGRLAYNTSIPDDTWLELTSETVAVTNGNLDFAHEVAERLSLLPASEEVLRTFDYLVRSSAKDYNYFLVDDLALVALRSASAIRGALVYERLRIALEERGHNTQV